MSEQHKGNGNVIVAGLWQTRNGHYQSMPVDAKGYDSLMRVFENGGKFLIRLRTQDAINRAQNPEKAPVAYLEFVPAEEVARFQAAKPTNTRSPL